MDGNNRLNILLSRVPNLVLPIYAIPEHLRTRVRPSFPRTVALRNRRPLPGLRQRLRLVGTGKVVGVHGHVILRVYRLGVDVERLRFVLTFNGAERLFLFLFLLLLICLFGLRRESVA